MITVELQLVNHWTKEPVSDVDVTSTLKVIPRWQRYRAPTGEDTSQYPIAFTELGQETEYVDGHVTNMGSGRFTASFEVEARLFEGVVEERSGPVYDNSTAWGKIGGQGDRLTPVGTVEVGVAAAGQSRTFTVVEPTVLYGPDGSWTETVDIDFISSGNDLILAAVGDSVMWGEGLSHAHKFVNLAARGIGELLGRRPMLAWFSARCGAVIEIDRTEDKNDFIDIYPHLFNSQEDRDLFLKDDSAAASLHSEIPCSFPTILTQLNMIDDSLGRTVDILFLDGGINDLDFTANLVADSTEAVQNLDLHMQAVFVNRVSMMLDSARAKCPKAVIVVTGYYAPFSYASDYGKMKDLAVYIKDENWVGLTLNSIANVFGFGENIPAIINGVRAQSAYGQSRSVFWLSRIVLETAFRDRAGGVGMMFVNPGFGKENAIFAKAPLIHEKYKEGGVTDSQHELRASVSRRAENLRQMELIHYRLSPGLKQEHLVLGDTYRQLRERLDGPTSLLSLLDGLIENSGNTRLWPPCRVALGEEISRIKRCLMASFIHPNEAGAARYAKSIVQRYERRRRMAVREHVEKLSRPASLRAVSARETLRQYGLNPKQGLRACMRHVFVDSIAVEIAYKGPWFHSSLLRPILDAPLVLNLGGGGSWVLSGGISPIRVTGREADFIELFTVDTLGSLHLGDISGFDLELGFHWAERHPEHISVLINGSEVFSGPVPEYDPNTKRVSLPYPAPLAPRRGGAPPTLQ